VDSVPGSSAEPDYLGLTVAEFLDRVAAPTAAPGAGAAAGMAVSLGAALTAMAAGLSGRHLPEADRLVARALQLQERAKPLGQRDAAAYQEVLEERGRPRDDPERADRVRAALSRAADVPLEIAEIGVAVMALAPDVVQRGNPNLRGDALTGCLLAQSGARAALVLVELDLDDLDDPRLRRAAQLSAALEHAPSLEDDVRPTAE
jgi:formiminotetrahydrofolate cyclodeaminase